MKKASFFIIILAVFCFVQPVFSGPKEMSEDQMTDISVNDTVATETRGEDGEIATPPDAKPSDMDMLKNPVDDPAELNKAEILRLENQAADRRVQDQINNPIHKYYDQ